MKCPHCGGYTYPALDHDKMMLKLYGVSVSDRGRRERKIVSALVDHLNAAGFRVTGVWDGEGFEKATTGKKAMEFIFNLDESRLYVQKKGKKGREHNVLLIGGNGVDIISDWNYTEGDPDGFSAAMNAFNPEKIV